MFGNVLRRADGTVRVAAGEGGGKGKAWNYAGFGSPQLQGELQVGCAVGSRGMVQERCDWCGKAIGSDEGYRAAEPAGERVAAFCRLEHVVPWAMKGPHWRAGTLAEPSHEDAGLAQCAQCGVPVGETRVVLVHHRGEHRVADALCGVDHLRAWAHAGGRWR